MTTPNRRPNIVLILTDDHAAHSIGAYGSVVNTSPGIDRIGEEGARLDNCFVTNSLCAPSRASILTGTYSHVNGVTTLFTPFDASQATFVSQLKDAGYRTGIVGKWHLGDGDDSLPQGFDHWDILVDHGGQGKYINPRFRSPDGVRTVEGYATDITTELGINWVESLDDDRPWCLLLWHKAPHRPWVPDEAHADLYSDPIPVPGTFWDDHSTRSASARRALMSIADYINSEDLKVDPPEGLTHEELALWKYQRFMEDYLRCVASVDDNVVRVTDWLAERGELDETVLTYSSDQGFFLGDHGWFDKRFMYEESLRMPFVVRFPPQIRPGTVVEDIVTNVDFAPTLLDAAGVEPAEGVQGRSFWELLGDTDSAGVAGDDQEFREGMYYRYWENDDWFHKAPAHYGYRDHRYKIIHYYNEGYGLKGAGFASYPSEWELYDLVEDPHELNNVYGDPSYAAVREELTEKLYQAQTEVGDSPGAPGDAGRGQINKVKDTEVHR